MNKTEIAHPGEERLLRYVDGELSSRGAAHVRTHLEACWRCRADVNDLQETIRDYVRYEQVVFDPLPDAPKSWESFEVRLDQLIAERRQHWVQRAIQGVLNRILGNRLAVAAMAAGILICFAIFQLDRPPSVSASELLKKTAARESTTARRGRLRIKTRTRIVTRPAVMAVNHSPESDTDTQLRQLFVDANYGWEEPLSAKSFSAWRDRLSDRHDDVSLKPPEDGHDAGIYQVRTRSQSNFLQEATLKMRSTDLGVVSGAFHFRGDQWVEMTALPDEPSPAPENPDDALKPASNLVNTPSGRQDPPEPDDTSRELRVIAALHSANADVGEQVELGRDHDGITITATGLAPQRLGTLRSALSGIPGVRLQFQEPHTDLSKSSEPQGSVAMLPTEHLSPTPLHAALEKAVGGVAALSRFMEQALETSDAAKVQVHNLRSLDERFSSEVETQFSREDRAILDRLRRDHIQLLAANVADLDHLVSPILGAMGAEGGKPVEAAPQPVDVHAGTQMLFTASQQLDRLLTALLTGNGSEHTDDLVAEISLALKQLRADVVAYRSVIEARR